LVANQKWEFQMMNRKNRWISALGLLCIAASPARAAEFWSDTTTVTALYPHGAGMTFHTGYTNPISTCGTNRWLLHSASPNYKVLVATLLMAHAQGLRVTFVVKDQAPTCEPEIDRFIAQR
jgi:hypothetical protein